MATVGGSQNGKQTREDSKKQKDMLEARRAGTMPPEVDDEGKEINPHIPQYMANAPWYLKQGANSLRHQRSQTDHSKYDKLGSWYPRGQKVGSAPTKYRKGACQNCGALTHKSKDCVDRPRKVGAKFSGKDFQPDEAIAEVCLRYDGKRDRWNGYDPSTHLRAIKEYEAIEAERRARREATLIEGNAQDEDKQIDDLQDQSERVKLERNLATQADPRTRTTIRNLRIREDTAKYLLNLDLNSAHYDPKTRSMRENPHPELNPADQLYAGDNQIRNSGEALDWTKIQVFCWDAAEKGAEVHMQAAPSHAEALYQEFKKKREQLKNNAKDKLLEKYGGAEHMEAPAKELLLGQSEHYIEYSRDGKIVVGAEKMIPKSKYPEDEYINNHTSVWGSYWEAGKWGYQCCKQYIKRSYCLANATKSITSNSAVKLIEEQSEKEKKFEESAEKIQKELAQRRMIEEMRKLNEEMSKHEEDTETKAKVEIAEKQKRRSDWARQDEEPDERKRKYNSARDDWDMPSVEEMESYRKQQIRPEDPMRGFLEE